MKLNKCILTDLGFVTRGKSKHRPRNDKSLFGGDYPFIQTGEVKSANFYLNTYSETYNEKGLAQSKLWNKGTLLITIAANIAETAILDIQACFPDSIIGFIPFENKSDVRFVKYYLDYIKKKLQVISQGTTQDNMSVEKLTAMSLYVPDYNVQVKIANILSNYDLLIENNSKRIKLLEEMAEELYKEWFVRLRFPNYENTKIVDGIPDGWKKLKFEDIFQIKNGYAFKSSEYLDTGIQVLRTKDYSNSKWIRIDESIFISEDSSKKYRNFFVKKYDFLVIMVGASIGKYGIALDKDTNLLLNQNQWAIRTKKEFNEYCLFKLMIMKNLLNVLLSQKTGAARDFFRKSFLNELEIILPPKSIIAKFNVLFTSFFEELNVLILKNQNLRETRDLLLPRLLSGKLNIEDLDIV